MVEGPPGKETMSKARRITVVWRAFTRPGETNTRRTITIESDLDDLQLCEEIFAATNLYQGPIWDALQPLPEDRTHTAISVNGDRADFVSIDGITYEVALMGFREVA